MDICSEEPTVFQEGSLRKAVRFEEHWDNVQGQISEHIFTPNGGYCVYYPSNLFRNMHSFENWQIFHNNIVLVYTTQAE